MLKIFRTYSTSFAMYKSRSSGFSTKLIHHGIQKNETHISDAEKNVYTPLEENYCYERNLLNEKLAALDNAKFALTFPSGLASATALFSLLKTGEHIVIASEIYGGTEETILAILTRFNIENTILTNVTNLTLISKSIKKNTKMVFFETPSNPLTTITDMEGLVREVRKISKDIIIANDNSFLTPYFQRPIDFGADINMNALTKFVNGHSDVLMGALVTNCKEYYNELYKAQTNTGNFPSPFDCKLLLQGMKSLPVRLERVQESSLALAKYLEKHPKVSKVCHPSLPSHPQHKLALKQSYGSSGVFSFYIKNGSGEDSKKLLASLKMVTSAPSFGGPETTMQIPSLTSHLMMAPADKLKLNILDSFLRVSVGFEDIQDIIDDFSQAFEKL